MNNEIRNRTIKYFIGQKLEETRDFLVLSLAGYFFFGVIPFLLGRYVDSFSEYPMINSASGFTTVIFHWGTGILLLIILLMCIVFLGYFMLPPIYNWVQSNWRRAKRRAKEDFKIDKAKRR